jgi:hypothetical protein
MPAGLGAAQLASDYDRLANDAERLETQEERDEKDANRLTQRATVAS